MGKIDHVPFKWAEFLWDDDQDDNLLIYLEFIECLLFARLAAVAVDTSSTELCFPNSVRCRLF